MKSVLFAITLVIAAAVLQAKLTGQSVTTAEIQGVVKDSTGAAVPKATIKVTQTSVHLVKVTTTQADGTFVIPDLPIGPYSLEVSAPGFSNYVQEGIELHVGNRLDIPVTLRVGSVNENVVVSSTGSLVDTEKSSVSEVINERSISSLPLNGRVATQLVLLTGTALTVNPTSAGPYWDFSGSEEYPTEIPLSVGGGGVSENNWLLDGADNMANGVNVSNAYPFPDALQEFDVETSSRTAREGMRPGSVVNMATKSGNNQFHGDLFEFLRNGSLNATNFFASAPDSLKRNQFGGTLGGPIIKNKLFFFVGYQGTRNRSTPPQSIAFVPTQAMLNGDFSTFESAACQSSGTPGTITDPSTGQPFPNDFVSPSRFDPAALNVLKFIPVSTNPCGKIVYAVPHNPSENMEIGRFDWNQSQKHLLFFRYFIADYTQYSGFDGKNLITAYPESTFRSINGTLGDTYTVSSTMVNSFRFGGNRLAWTRGGAANLPGPDSLGVNDKGPSGGSVGISVAGGFSEGSWPHAFMPTTAWQISDDFDIVHGRHHLGFGFEGMREYSIIQNFWLQDGSFSFDGSYTGSAMLDFMLGDVGLLQQSNAGESHAKQNVVTAYVDDAIHVNSHLTLTAGLRYEPFLPQYDAGGEGDHFDSAAFAAGVKSNRYKFSPPGLLFNSDPGIPFAYTRTQLNNFEPRVGLAWDRTGKGQETLRVGYARMSDPTQMGWFYQFSTMPPWGYQLFLEHPPGPLSNPYAGYPGGNPFTFPLPPPSPASAFGVGTAYDSLPLHFPIMTVDQWNIAYQRQLGANWVLTATYMGNKSTHVWIVQDLNPAVYIPGNCVAGQYGLTVNGPCSTEANTQQRRLLTLQNPAAGPYYSTIIQPAPVGNGEYNALLLSAKHTLSKNFTMTANYTYSHCIDTNDIVGEPYLGMNQDPSNFNAERGNCMNDRRHLFVASLVANSPNFGQPWQRRFLGNWQLSAIITAQSGPWFTPQTGLDNSLTAEGLDRPNVVGDPYPAHQSPSDWINPLAFSPNPIGTFGNAGRNSLLAPGLVNFDIGVSRFFQLSEVKRLEFRFEGFNAFNHPNFGIPDGNLQDSTFGQILSAADPRILQFGLKFYF
jgi:Carboxypeptidase regulatory-like domain